MGFNTVYRFLSEIFPQVDARLLKAVAIEHSKDADAAANVVLTEILPYWTKRNATSSSVPEDHSVSSDTSKDQILRDFSEGDGAEHEEQSSLSRRRRIVVRKRNKNACSSPEPSADASGYATNTNSTHAHCPDLASLSKALNASIDSNFCDAHDGNNQLPGNNESEEVILLGKTQESSNEAGSNTVSILVPNTMANDDNRNADISDVCAYNESDKSVSSDKGQGINIKVGPEQDPLVMLTPLIHENGVVNCSLTDQKDSDDHLVHDFDTSIFGKSHQEESCLDCPLVVVENLVTQLVPSSCALQLGTGSGTSNTDCKIPDAGGSSGLKSEQENFIGEKGSVEDDSMINTVVTRSGQICRIDLLEDIIQDAKNNKKTLFTAMESVMNMMREVELKEKAAEEAKAEAARGGLDILIKVEELKHMLSHAKEANDMHAGEIYGEKAILATEARELQNRLLSLSEERDKSLAALDEMRETLECRLAAAEEMRKAAEEEKLGKEESAQNSRAELEAIMEKVVQESKTLQQEAEENSKLREFLMDRGRVVDTLQGEISVICQDVRLLKEKFDERVPLSKSVSSSQTTCILASSGSSGSSIRSTASLVADHCLTSEIPEATSITPTVDIQSPKSRLEEERTGANRRELLDDGWDFFDNDTELYGRAL